MAVYSIKFTGYYPVGAVAVVAAESKDEAVLQLINDLRSNHPQLANEKGNQFNKLMESNTELDFVLQPCQILLDGKY